MRITAALILTALTITPPAAAQEKMDTAVYKVEFNIHYGRSPGESGPPLPGDIARGLTFQSVPGKGTKTYSLTP